MSRKNVVFLLMVLLLITLLFTGCDFILWLLGIDDGDGPVLAITPTQTIVSIPIGQTYELTVLALDSDGLSEDFTYSVANPSIIEAVKSGSTLTLSGLSEGTTILTINSGSGLSLSLNVTVTSGGDKTLLTFSFASPQASGIINQEQNTVYVLLDYGVDRSSLVPIITHSGVSITPGSGVAQDFSQSVTYTITAEDGSQRPYIVSVVNKALVSGIFSQFDKEGNYTPSGYGLIAATTAEGVSTLVRTAEDGSYSIALAPGDYIIKPLLAAQDYDVPLTAAAGLNYPNTDIEFPRQLVEFLIINDTKTALFFNEPNVRIALAEAVNRDSAAQTLTDFQDTMIYSSLSWFLLPYATNFSEGILQNAETFESDSADTANEAMADIPAALNFTIQYNTSQTDIHKRLVECVQTDWENLDKIDSVSLLEKSWTDHVADLDNLADKPYDVLRMGWMAGNDYVGFFSMILKRNDTFLFIDGEIENILGQMETAINTSNVILYEASVIAMNNALVSKAYLIPLASRW